MKILLISDIHANFPALQAIWNHFREPFDLILNGGDTTVYGPFPNQTIDWLRDHEVVSILGNTDRHVLQLLEGRTFKKPRKAEKRVMYGWTAAELSEPNREWLRSQPMSQVLPPISREPAEAAMCHWQCITAARRTQTNFYSRPRRNAVLMSWPASQHSDLSPSVTATVSFTAAATGSILSTPAASDGCSTAKSALPALFLP